MKFDEYISYINQDRKKKRTFDNIRDEFIKNGYEKFLLLSYSEETEIEAVIKKKMNTLKRIKMPHLLLPIINTISEEHSDELLTLFFSYSPNKKYFMSKEISKRAYKSILLPNLYDDDPSLNHMVMFKKEQVKDAYLLFRSIRVSAMDGLAAYSVYGVDILFLTDLCSIDNKRICFPRPNPLTHFCGNMTRRDNDPYLIKQSREIIGELMSKEDFSNELEFSYSLRRFLMEKIQAIYLNNAAFFEGQIQNGMLEAYCKDELERIYSDLVAKNEVPVKWKSEKQLFDLIYSTFPDSVFQYMPDWLIPQSLDIYVPSLKLAFEYQGIQHYEAVEFFGGEEGLKHRKFLDDKKKKLCKENGVHLIEWHYQDTITKPVLRKKLGELSIKI